MEWISPDERLPHDTLGVCTLWLCLADKRVVEGGYRPAESIESAGEGIFYEADGEAVSGIAWWRPMPAGTLPPLPPGR